jgi:hypothetical protein
MARIKFTGLISEIRGQLNDTIIQGWKSGVFSVKKMMTGVNNPNSLNQDKMRANVTESSKVYTDILSQAQRDAYDAWALTKPGYYPAVPGVRQIIPTNNGVMSGINALVMSNGWLTSCGLALSGDAPLAKTPPSPPTVVAATCVGGTLTVTWVKPSPAMAGSKVRIWIASASGKFHKQLNCVEAYDTLTKAITTIRGAHGNSLTVTQFKSELVYIQMDTVSPDGTKSPGSNTATVVLA